MISNPSLRLTHLVRGLFLPLSLLASLPWAEAGNELPFVVSTQELADHLNDPAWITLHVSDGTSEYEEGHIPGALYVDWDRFVDNSGKVPNELPPLEKLQRAVHDLGIESGSRIVLYDSAVGIRAARIFVTLDVLGLAERAALLDGQFAKWRSEGRPTEQGPAPVVEPSKIEIQPNLDRIVRIDEIKTRLDDQGRPKPDFGPKLLDARSPKQFAGSESGGGHIPGAQNLPWEKFIVAGEIPVLRPRNELIEVEAEEGIDPRDPVVTYCNSGQSASLLYFVLRNLGNDVRLYDGSFSEWSQEEDAHIDKGEAPTAPAEK